MVNPELRWKNPFEINVSVPCPQCKKPMTTGFPQAAIDICKENSKIYITVMCDNCNQTFFFFPATDEILQDGAVV